MFVVQVIRTLRGASSAEIVKRHGRFLANLCRTAFSLSTGQFRPILLKLALQQGIPCLKRSMRWNT